MLGATARDTLLTSNVRQDLPSRLYRGASQFVPRFQAPSSLSESRYLVNEEAPYHCRHRVFMSCFGVGSSVDPVVSCGRVPTSW